MSTGSPQLVRQWLLLKKLAASRVGLRVEELAEVAEVSVKTVRRDLLVFRDAGFPLEEATGPAGRKTYRLAAAAHQPDLSFSYDEALSLYVSRRWLRPLAGTVIWEAAERAYRKIEASLGAAALKYLDKVLNAFYETPFGIGDSTERSEVIDRLLLGIEDRRVVFITYRSQRSTETVTYDIHPYCLTRHRHTLYLIGFKPDDQDFRIWKVNRIEQAEVDRMPFVRRADFDAEKFLAGSLGVYRETGDLRAVVRFSPEVARYVEESRWHPSQHCQRQSDGGLLLELKLSGTRELKSWVLGFGRHAEVLQPDGLRAEIAEDLAAALIRYRQAAGAPAGSRVPR